MTLALLLTAVGGAWAQTETLLTTITATGTEQASYSDHNYGNRHRASQLQYGECGNRFIH